ncbi:hypothetical protein CMUS01_08050 [Colletotrichum musicola]|uniref:LDB19 N-terminal domain-containing protein n=1 Tax=Colletotrichum musicola TaxID=2175873 RepID=A0A8H6KDS2_9PEZI|nr:hypothetical protein CMUS01_08050 [Colletotrichum musicola]
MPHRVANFLTENFNVSALKAIRHQTQSHKQQQQQQQQQQRKHNNNSNSNIQDQGLLRRVPLDRHSSYSSDDGEHIPYNAMFAEPADHLAREKKQHKDHHHHHRLSLPFGRSSRDAHENPHAGLDLKIESPPIVFFGDAESSTGALVSGQMFLDVRDDHLEVESFEAKLNIHVHQKRPFTNHCADCANQYTELKRWTFLGGPTTLKRGLHPFPFSILLEGHLPASMDTPVMSIAYEFRAEAVLAKRGPGAAQPPAPLRFEHNFDVKRSLHAPEFPHHSVRVFPPTNIKASAHYSQVVHPAGTHNVSFRLDGLTTANQANKTVEFWKLKKVTWKLEETIKTVAPSCERHAPAGAQAGQKGVARSETRVLGEKYMHDGWKSDYGSADGHVEFEFDYGVLATSSKHGHHAPRYACDAKSSDGTEVSHALMIEMVVSKEWAPAGKPHLATQTGTGRILRMHYHVLLTECPGLGVSWDNEAPPVYQDVPPSPPSYPRELRLLAEEEAPEYDSLESLDGHSAEGSRRGSQEGRN